MLHQLQDADGEIAVLLHDGAVSPLDRQRPAAAGTGQNGVGNGKADGLSHLRVDAQRRFEVELHRQCRNVGAVEQDVSRHIAGLDAKIIVIDAVGSDAAQIIHARFTADDRDAIPLR